MDDHLVVYSQYVYVSMTGNKYSPVFDKKRSCWYIVQPSNTFTIKEIAILCNIPDEDVVILKLSH